MDEKQHKEDVVGHEPDVQEAPPKEREIDTPAPTTPNPAIDPFNPGKIEPDQHPKPKASISHPAWKQQAVKEQRMSDLGEELSDLAGGEVKLMEAPVDYGDVPERMHPDVERKLGTKEHPLGAHPAFPDDDDSGNFEELVASKRFRDVITNLKRYANITQPITSLQQLTSVLIETLNAVMKIESQHQEQLEQLAVEVIMTEFGLDPRNLGFKVALKDMQEIDLSDIPNQPDEADDFEHLAQFDGEVEKRRFINAMIQGAAVKTTYAYYMIQDRLNEMDPNLLNMYSILASFSEFGYWVTPDEVATQMKGAAAVGKSQIDLTGDKPIVIATATSFPYLVHELSKGVMEVISQHGLPKDPEARKYVLNKADFLDAEHWDLRLGPGLWEKFQDMVGEANEAEIRNNLYAVITAMPPDEFNRFMKELLKGSDEGKKRLRDLAGDIRRQINAS